MAKNSKRHGKESEYQLGIIRELRKEVKSLKQRIKSLERLEYNYLQSKNQPKYVPIEMPKDNKNICPSCKDDFVESRVIAGRIFDACPSCKYRSKATKISNLE